VDALIGENKRMCNLLQEIWPKSNGAQSGTMRLETQTYAESYFERNKQAVFENTIKRFAADRMVGGSEHQPTK
jgi:hypothetical protein